MSLLDMGCVLRCVLGCVYRMITVSTFHGNSIPCHRTYPQQRSKIVYSNVADVVLGEGGDGHCTWAS